MQPETFTIGCGKDRRGNLRYRACEHGHGAAAPDSRRGGAGSNGSNSERRLFPILLAEGCLSTSGKFHNPHILLASSAEKFQIFLRLRESLETASLRMRRVTVPPMG